MACNVDDRALTAYLEDALPFESRERLEGHIRGCPQCLLRLLQLGHMTLSRGEKDTGDALPRSVDGYELQYLIAASSKAFVYRASGQGGGPNVAVKIMRPEALSEPGSLERFRREARLAMSLRHPNIVHVFGTGEAGTLLYIVMEYVPGLNLHQIVLRHGRLGVRSLLGVTRRVAEALAFAHERGIIHRDVKPSNVLIDTRYGAKVGDFGLADESDKDAGEPRTRHMIGSPVCMPPEQARGEQADVRSDVYGLGCVMFFMLTGRFPFTGDRSSLVRGHLTEPPPRPGELVPAAPAWLDDVILRCLEKDRGRRWPNMAALIAAIDEGQARGAGEGR